MALPSPSPIRILAVDDHPLLRTGMAAIIGLQADMSLVGEADNGAEAVEQFRTLRPDITLMDLQMPGGNGFEAINSIRALDPNARIIVLTTYSGDAHALKALKAGAAGFLMKNALRKELLDAIRKVYAGGRYLSQDVANEIAFRAVEEPLSQRETEILWCVAAGDGNKQIARRLSVSEHTIKADLKSVFSKLNVDDRISAVMVAARRGLIEI